MKRFFAAILIFCLMTSMLSCGLGNRRDWNTSAKDDTGNAEGEAPEVSVEPNEPSPLSLSTWTAHSFDKISASALPPQNSGSEYKVYMTRGESEGFLIALRSSEEASGLSLELVGHASSGLSYKTYILDTAYEIDGVTYSDPARDYSDGESFTLKADSTLSFLVEFESTDKTPSGLNKYVFELRDSEGRTAAQYQIVVKVWNIVMPQKTFITSVGIDKESILGYYGKEGELSEEEYVKYYDTLLSYGITPAELPYDILDERADAYMSDPRVTSFRVPHDVSDETLIAYYKKLKPNLKWLAKAYIMPTSEPSTPDEIKEFQELAKRIRLLCPMMKVTTPFDTDIELEYGWDQINEMTGYSTVWCPKLCMWNDEYSYSGHSYTHTYTFEYRMRNMMQLGYGVWTYLDETPGSPYASLSLTGTGVSQRALFWQQYQRGIGGFVYASSTDWKNDPWTSLDNGRTDGNGNTVYGEGILLYPSKDEGGSPTVSHRLIIMRDGVEDCELMRVAAVNIGNSAVNAIISSVTESLYSVDISGDEFVKIRIDLGNALEKDLTD